RNGPRAWVACCGSLATIRRRYGSPSSSCWVTRPSWRACAPRPTPTATAGRRSGSPRRWPGASASPKGPRTGGPSVHVAHELPLGRGGEVLAWAGPALVGVLNVTPDSFSDGGSHGSVDAAVAAGAAMAAQ